MAGRALPAWPDDEPRISSSSSRSAANLLESTLGRFPPRFLVMAPPPPPLSLNETRRFRLSSPFRHTRLTLPPLPLWPPRESSAV